ncbi:hypothetical protein ES703_00054 [subsurface metagenome]
MQRNLNPSSVTLADIQTMSPREFRQYTFLKMGEMGNDLKQTKKTVMRQDTRLWGVLVAVIITAGTVIASAVL